MWGAQYRVSLQPSAAALSSAFCPDPRPRCGFHLSLADMCCGRHRTPQFFILLTLATQRVRASTGLCRIKGVRSPPAWGTQPCHRSGQALMRFTNAGVEKSRHGCRVRGGAATSAGGVLCPPGGYDALSLPPAPRPSMRAIRPLSRASGVGGQPGMVSCTGITEETGPTQA